MNFIDYIIIGILLLTTFQGFRKGAISSAVTLVGMIVVIILAWYLKNPVSALMYQHLPFFNIGGALSGISVFNILIYEGLAFVAMIILLGTLLKIAIKLSGILDTLLNMTIILGLPSKIIGAIVGFIQGYLIAFIIIFIFSTFSNMSTRVNESEYGNFLLERTPILSRIVGDTHNAINEIIDIVRDHEDNDNKDEANLRSLEVLLRRGVITPDSAMRLVENERLVIPGAVELIREYQNR